MSVSIKTAVKNFQGRYGDNARENIAELLKSGNVVAYAQDTDRVGPKQKLYSDFWLGLDARETQAVFESGTYHFTDKFDGENVSTREVVIELDQPMMSVLGAKLETQNSRASPSRAGAHPVIEWDQVWTIVIVLVHEDGLGDTQEDFIEKIQLRLQNALHLDVGRTALQDKIRPLWRMLKDGASAKDVFTKRPRKPDRRAKKTTKNQLVKKSR